MAGIDSTVPAPAHTAAPVSAGPPAAAVPLPSTAPTCAPAPGTALQDRLAGWVSDLTTLHELTERVSRTDTLPEALDELLRAGAALVGAARGLVVLDPADGPSTTAALGLDRADLGHLETVPRASLPHARLLDGLGERELLITDLSAEEGLDPRHREVAGRLGYAAVYGVRLERDAGGGVAGGGPGVAFGRLTGSARPTGAGGGEGGGGSGGLDASGGLGAGGGAGERGAGGGLGAAAGLDGSVGSGGPGNSRVPGGPSGFGAPGAGRGSAAPGIAGDPRGSGASGGVGTPGWVGDPGAPGVVRGSGASGSAPAGVRVPGVRSAADTPGPVARPCFAGAVVWLYDEAGAPDERRRHLVRLYTRFVAAHVGRLLEVESTRACMATITEELLPSRLPRVAGVQLAVRHRRGARGGGDWYDALPLPDAALGLSVGSVTGAGPSAVAAMGRLRASLRAYAVMEGEDPVAVLSDLELLLRLTEPARSATALFAYCEPALRKVTLAGAGHCPPLLVGDRRTEFVETSVSAPLGMLSCWEAPSVELEAEPGETVLLYTDGLLRRTGDPVDRAFTRLHAAAAGVPRALRGDPGAVADHVLRAMVPDEEGGAEDVVLLAARFE
ncbi:SpoIIE family protein phosphatase [Streptomyces niveiscabiei]|uniref:SpoIIE family protein phosphatase n=1 Tax=Streptomyces niveiscabiei TaxID=164115 RepID=UPI0029CA8BBE|nr:SpoIIE family protein phosphatase [Streptomyces niveiscabiei]